MKWLGNDAINALAVDGKGGKGELLKRVAQWVAASGRNVTQPGAFFVLCGYHFSSLVSDDRVL